jgi:hypothetical protein
VEKGVPGHGVIINKKWLKIEKERDILHLTPYFVKLPGEIHRMKNKAKGFYGERL